MGPAMLGLGLVLAMAAGLLVPVPVEIEAPAPMEPPASGVNLMHVLGLAMLAGVVAAAVGG